MSTADLSSHILYVAKTPVNKSNRTGANAIVDILVKSGNLTEENGHLIVSRSEGQELANNQRESSSTQDQDIEVAQPLAETGLPIPPPNIPASNIQAVSASQTVPSLHIDIQIHISADSSPEQIDQIFSSMAKHLYRVENSQDE